MKSRCRSVSSQQLLLSAITVVIFAAAACCLAQTSAQPLAAPSSGLINPRAIVFNPSTGKVYAVDTAHNTVEIYSRTGKTERSVSVGSEPVSVTVNTATGMAYVANGGDGSVSVIDGSSDAVKATISVGSHPYSVAADPATGKAFVTHTFGEQLSILDGATNTARDLKTGSSDLIAIDSRTGTVYLLGYGGAVKVLNEETQTIRELPVGKHAWGLTLIPRPAPFISLESKTRTLFQWPTPTPKLSPFQQVPSPAPLRSTPSTIRSTLPITATIR